MWWDFLLVPLGFCVYFMWARGIFPMLGGDYLKLNDLQDFREWKSNDPNLIELCSRAESLTLSLAEENQKEGGLLETTRSWEFDLGEGCMTLVGEEKRVKVAIQLIGSYHYSTKCWMWAWSHSSLSLSHSIIADSLELKRYGETHSIPPFTSRAFIIDELQAWEFSSIANLLMKRRGDEIDGN